MAFLELDGAGKKIGGQYVVKDITFTQEEGEKIAIAGETGSGKTTLLKLIGGHSQLEEGRIFFEGESIIGPLDQLLPGHPGTAFLSQHFELRNNYFVHEILSYANELSATEASELYATCRINHLLSRKTNELSGGERQRIALTRLLISQPRLLLLDEPFSNLDALHKLIIKQVLNDLGEKFNISFILVSHDAEDMLSWADTILVMQSGRLIQKGKPEDVYANPVNAYCAGLFGLYNVLEHTGMGESRFIRPEDIILLDEPGELSFSSGLVKSINYYGSHYLIEVMTKGNPLIINAGTRRYKKSDQVYFILPSEENRL